MQEILAADDTNKWRDIFNIICSKSDFRQLLVLKRVSKKISSIVELEIARREPFIYDNPSTTNGFYSDSNFWYLGRICSGFSVLNRIEYDKARLVQGVYEDIAEIKHSTFYPCSKWEEITLFGDKKLCRSCITLKREKDKEEAEQYAAHLHKFRTETAERDRFQRQADRERQQRPIFHPKNK